MDDVTLADMMAPIAGDLPAGSDVRMAGQGSELYLTIKDDRAIARSAEREALTSGDPEIDPLAAGLRAWNSVSTHGSTLLAQHAKDLQVAAWLVEAWLRIDGFPGLADGFTLLAELVENYWDEGLYPAEDEDGAEARLAPLFGLFGRDEPGTLIQPIKLLPLTDNDGAHVALWTIETVRAQAVRHDDPEVREELAARRAQRLDQLDTAVARASPAFLRDSLTSIERALGEMERLMIALDARTQSGRFGSQVATPLVAAADILRAHHVAHTVGDDSPSPIMDGVAEAVPASAPTDATDANAAPPKQNLQDREGAFATLLEIAGFFERTEPQSFIAVGLRDLVRRANLSLDELMVELIPDREQRAMILMRAGVRAQASEGDGFSSF